jgi:hypothetical protein
MLERPLPGKLVYLGLSTHRACHLTAEPLKKESLIHLSHPQP